VHGGGRVAELAKRVGYFAHARTRWLSPAPCQRSLLNKSGTTKKYHGVVTAFAGALSRLANLLVDGHLRERSARLSYIT
jgi:hypothetical protein